MKLFRVTLSLACALVLVGVAYVGQAKESAGTRMATAAKKLQESLTPEQREKAIFAYDSKERTNWFFTPRQDAKKRTTRKGLPLAEMTEEQKKAALALLRAGTSEGGYTKATTIMSLESILHDLESGGSMVRNPGWYFFTLFGDPTKNGHWGWRVEGHHLSLNFALDGGKVIMQQVEHFFGVLRDRCAQTDVLSVGPIVCELHVDVEIVLFQERNDFLQCIAVFAADANEIALY